VVRFRQQRRHRVHFVSGTEITAISPAGAGTVGITVSPAQAPQPIPSPTNSTTLSNASLSGVKGSVSLVPFPYAVRDNFAIWRRSMRRRHARRQSGDVPCSWQATSWDMIHNLHCAEQAGLGVTDATRTAT
jgi:hypothetical protein